MLYTKLVEILAAELPELEVYLASDMDPNWEGVVVEMGSVRFLISPDSTTHASNEPWQVDTMVETEEAVEVDVNIYDDIWDAIGAVVGKTLLVKYS